MMTTSKQRLGLSLVGIIGLMGLLAAWWEPSGEAGVAIQVTEQAAPRVETVVPSPPSQAAPTLEEFDFSERRKTALVGHILGVDIEPLAAAEIQSTLLGPNTLLLEYSLDANALWLVSSKSIRGYTLPDRARIEEAASRVRDLLGRGARREVRVSLDLALLRLSDLVLKPVAAELGTKDLVIVADGALSRVPFAILSVEDGPDLRPRPLALSHSIVNLPSASTLSFLRHRQAARPAPEKELAILADPVVGESDPRLPSRPAVASSPTGLPLPRLPFSRQEAMNISALARGRTFTALGFAANRRAVLEGDLRGYGILHFATHADPQNSGLLLSSYDPDGRPQDPLLRGADIDRLGLDANLVVLSACATGLSSDGISPMVRHFWRGGASNVLVSYWSVEDRATAALMSSFYRFLLQQRLAPAAALRAAQVEIRNDPRWSSPYFWAGFGLYGDWR